jgi:hypothetical protein
MKFASFALALALTAAPIMGFTGISKANGSGNVGVNNGNGNIGVSNGNGNTGVGNGNANVGAYNGWNNVGVSNGVGNVGSYNGWGNTGVGNGSANVGSYNGWNNTGVSNGVGNVGSYNGWSNTGVSNGNGNVGSYNGWSNTGVSNGNANVGSYNGWSNVGTSNGNANVGTYNGWNNTGTNNGNCNIGSYNGWGNVGTNNGNCNIGTYNGWNNTGTGNGSGTATDTGTTLSYQWYKDGIALAGATSPTYTVSSATTADAGTYTVAVSGSSGVITPPATLVVVEAARVGGLIGLSTRALGGTGSQTLIVGFTVAGGDKRVLVRGVGPTLTDFGLTGALTDPHLALFSATGTLLAANDNWGGTSELSTAFSSAGEFPLPAASKDAALVSTLAPGSYTAHIAPATGEPGVSLSQGRRLAGLTLRRTVDTTLDGQVVDASFGRPVGGAAVTLQPAAAGSGSPDSDSKRGRTVQAGEDGRFTVSQLPAGRYLVEVTASGYLPQRFAAAVPHRGELRGVSVRLEPLRVRLLGQWQRVAQRLLGQESRLRTATPRELLEQFGRLRTAAAVGYGATARDLQRLTDLVEQAYYSPRVCTAEMLADATGLADAVLDSGAAPGVQLPPPEQAAGPPVPLS